MTDREKELVKNYPEADAFAGAATSVWNGSISPIKIEMLVKGRLYAELQKMLHKDIQTIFLTDSGIRHIKKKHGSADILENARPRCLVLTVSRPLELTSETTLGGFF
jgi:hypothetical protein